MRKRNYKLYLRKSHRYLGIFVGVQFLFWTLGGLYFSWTNIEEIRGENLRKKSENINVERDFISPKIVFDEFKKKNGESAKINSFRLIEIFGEPFYEINYETPETVKIIAVSVLNGKIREQISETEAKTIAFESLKEPLRLKTAEFLTKKTVGEHHEYREKPLPAWAVTFEDDLTVYLSAETGQIGAYRTNKWRVFDFLWMLHTLDFKGRDNINNYFLRGFSILGIITILSGFALFCSSFRFVRKLEQKLRSKFRT